jgi:hypothetical protein
LFILVTRWCEHVMRIVATKVIVFITIVAHTGGAHEDDTP